MSLKEIVLGLISKTMKYIKCFVIFKLAFRTVKKIVELKNIAIRSANQMSTFSTENLQNFYH